jgi:HAE1 family hydrophobic/amphiphilic exporter-1
LERAFKAIESGYASALAWVMRHKPLTLGVFGTTVVLVVVLYVQMPTGFFPQQDTAFFVGQMETAQDSSFENTARKIEQVGRIMSQDPDVVEAHFFAVSNAVNNATINAALPIKGEGRKATVDEVIARLRPKLAQVVGARTVLRASQDINIGARTSKAQYQYTLSDTNLAELNDWAPRMLEAMEKMPQLRDVSTDQQSNGAAVNLTIDRDAAGRFGIRPADIDTAIYNQIGQHQVAQYYTQLNAYRVVVEAPPDLQVSDDLFNYIYVLSPVTAKLVPLSLFVKASPVGRSLLSIPHQGQMPAVTLSFNLGPGVALGQVTKTIEQTRLRLGAPGTLNGEFRGTAQAFQASLANEPILILTALLSVYVILGVLYESFVHPLTIISTLPSAGLGALLALLVAGQELNIIGIIALILLIGIVKKNGIMIVDVALTLEREQGLGPEAAAVEASHRRLRPILMTTCCAFFGSMPLIFTLGAGSEFRRPLGVAIVGGLLVSQALTLFTTPVIYVYLDRLRRHRVSESHPSAAISAPQPAMVSAAALIAD